MKSSVEFVPLLRAGEVDKVESTVWPEGIKSRWWKQMSTCKFVFLVVSFLVFYTSVIAIVAVQLFSVGAPVNNALDHPKIRYQPTLSITAGMSPYAGGPGEKIDEAWHNLMSSISVRVSQKELNRNGNHQESVELPENGGYMAWLGVFHQLHCLKMIRQMNYRDYYFPNQTEKDSRDMEVHINHCIEQLRQAVVCQPDTSFTTFVWTHSDPKPVLDVRRFERQCVDWDYFMEGVKPRVVSFEEVDELINPYLNNTGKTP